jgi:hypothetical protein
VPTWLPTDADLTDAERAAVARITRTIEIAMTIAATPDQVMPLARLLTLATTAAEIESINADMERTIGKVRRAQKSAARTVSPAPISRNLGGDGCTISAGGGRALA